MKALAFSGGKDSLACWYLCRPEMVIWVNTGKSYPETRAIVDMVRAECKQFIDVLSDRDAQNAAEGLPSDLVPIDCTVMGQTITGAKPVTVQSYLGCCYANISKPLHDAAKRHGVTHLIRGQRTEEGHKSPARNGDMVDGIIYEHPIEQWGESDVLVYLRQQMGILPAHFSIKHSSLDCYDCTAFAADSVDRIRYMKQHHPAKYAGYRDRLNALRSAIAEPHWQYERLSGV